MKKNKITGLIGTAVLHILLLILLLVIAIRRPQVQEEGGVPVMLGNTELSQGNADPYTLTDIDIMNEPEAPAPDVSEPETVPPVETKEEIITQTEEETVAVPKKEPKKETPKKEKPKKETPKKDVPKKEAVKPKEKTEAEKRAEAEKAAAEKKAAAERAAAEAAAKKIAGAFGKGTQMGNKGTGTTGSGLEGSPTGNSSEGKSGGVGGYGTFDLNGRSLGSDGLPIGQSPLYQGKEDPSIQKSFQDRDPRLYQTVADSLRIMSAMGTNYTEGTSPTGYPTKKFLNDEWWVAGLDYCTGRLSPADAPCIRYAEVLLNYVEARYEIAQVGGNAFSQSDLDKSINELRDRQLTKWGDTEAKTMPKVQLNGSNLSVNGVVINDPARDPDVNPVLWEIRRERRIELIMEGRRGEDLRRWAKFEYLNSEDANGYPTMSFLGAYVNMADYPEISSKDDSGKRVLYLFDPENPGNEDTEKGYIYYLREKELRIFKAGELNSERYYLRAIPAAQLTIYENKGQVLTQNPGW